MAKTVDISKPVCLCQDHRTCLPARLRIIPLTSNMKGVSEIQICREKDTFKGVLF